MKMTGTWVRGYVGTWVRVLKCYKESSSKGNEEMTK
jgi:hypothetical protein